MRKKDQDDLAALEKRYNQDIADTKEAGRKSLEEHDQRHDKFT